MQNEEINIEEKHPLAPFLEEKKIAWFLIGTAIFLTIIENFLKMNYLIGSWHIIGYIVILIPLLYLSFTNRLINKDIKWFFIPLFVMIVDMFIFNNDLVQYFVPLIFYSLVTIITINSMHQITNIYQTLIPRSSHKSKMIAYLKLFFSNLLLKENDKNIYKRIGIALLITVPFLLLFVSLLLSADTGYEKFLTSLFSFKAYLDSYYLFTIPLVFFLSLTLFVFGFSNTKDRTQHLETKALDMLIVGIFLGMINLLFITFVLFQIPFLLNGDIPQNITLANFAREGFFQLMMVMGFVLLIFLFIMRRFKGEKLTNFLLIGLLFQTIMMGITSLKKMYLYQSIKGATSLRYYVEWFDYFLIIILLIGILFLVKKLSFVKFLNIITIVGTVSFCLIISINIDALIASHNYHKFKNNVKKLDVYSLRHLSIDALPVVRKNAIDLSYKSYNEKTKKYFTSTNRNWYKKSKRQECKIFATYHYGYCSILKKYGN